MGFAEQLRAILGGMPESRQTLLFSATMPAALAEFARAGLREPELVRLDAESKISPDLGLAFFTVRCALHWLQFTNLTAALTSTLTATADGRVCLVMADWPPAQFAIWHVKSSATQHALCVTRWT